MRHVEQSLQRQVVEYLGWALPAEVFWTAFPAGGGGELRGKILRGMGLKSGVPDILLVWRGQTLGIELKTPRGALSEAQRRTHDAMKTAGCYIAVCRSFDAVRGALVSWGVPTRETKADRVILPLAASLDEIAGRR